MQPRVINVEPRVAGNETLVEGDDVFRDISTDRLPLPLHIVKLVLIGPILFVVRTILLLLTVLVYVLGCTALLYCTCSCRRHRLTEEKQEAWNAKMAGRRRKSVGEMREDDGDGVGEWLPRYGPALSWVVCKWNVVMLWVCLKLLGFMYIRVKDQRSAEQKRGPRPRVIVANHIGFVDGMAISMAFGGELHCFIRVCMWCVRALHAVDAFHCRLFCSRKNRLQEYSGYRCPRPCDGV